MLPGAGRCGAQQQQPGDRTGANRSGGEHHTERGGAHRSGAAPEQDCSGTDQSRAAHRQGRSWAYNSGVQQRSFKRGGSACARGNCSPHECKRACSHAQPSSASTGEERSTKQRHLREGAAPAPQETVALACTYVCTNNAAEKVAQLRRAGVPHSPRGDSTPGEASTTKARQVQRTA